MSTRKKPKEAEPEEDYYVTLISVTGFKRAELHLLANRAPRVDDPDSIDSVILDLVFSAKEVSWTPIHTVESWVTSMDETAKGTLVAVSMDGELLTFRGKTRSVQDLRCPKGIMAVWAAGEDEYFAAGGGGERIRVSGKSVDLSPESGKRNLNDVHGTSGKDVMIVGDDGAVHRYDGKKWRELDSPTNYNLLGVHCRSEKEAYVCGAEGALFRFDGDDWEELESPGHTFYTMAWYMDELYLAAGEEGVFVLRKDGPEPIKKIHVYRLRAAGDYLFAWGNNLLMWFDGKQWKGGEVAL